LLLSLIALLLFSSLAFLALLLSGQPLLFALVPGAGSAIGACKRQAGASKTRAKACGLALLTVRM
jgi:hypothetical protein